MSEVKTPEPIAPRPRKTIAAELRAKVREASDIIRSCGALLLEGQAGFPVKEQRGTESAFMRWAANVTGWKPAMVYRIMQASAILEETPKAAKIADPDGIVALGRLDQEARAAVLKEAGSSPSAKTVKEVAKRLYPPKPRESREVSDAEKDAKRVGALARKHADAILETLSAVDGLPTLEVLVAGAVLASKIGADAAKVIRMVYADAFPTVDDLEGPEVPEEDRTPEEDAVLAAA